MIAVLDYGIGNLRSAQKALEHVGAAACLVQDPKLAARADAVVLPGVGAFGGCAQALRATGLDLVALEAIDHGTPFLGICVGFQLLFEASEEAPGIPGLGVLRGTVQALPVGVKHPQMQWNRLDRTGEPSRMLAGLEPSPWAYFVHSFAPVPDVDDGVVATCDYGGTIVAAVERGGLWGTQFHPEKSAAEGLAILANFVSVATTGGLA